MRAFQAGYNRVAQNARVGAQQLGLGLYNIQKKPSTSEVIDWIRALELGGVPASKIKEAVPFAGVLLKKNEDIDTMRKFLK